MLPNSYNSSEHLHSETYFLLFKTRKELHTEHLVRRQAFTTFTVIDREGSIEQNSKPKKFL